MYHPTVEELNKTPWEKQMAQQMTLDNSGVTLSYRNVLYIIQQHLKTLYGDMATGTKIWESICGQRKESIRHCSWIR